MSASREFARRRKRADIELNCLLCSRELGVLQCDGWPVYGQVPLRPLVGASVLVADWRRLRCVNCGGAAVPGDVILSE